MELVSKSMLQPLLQDYAARYQLGSLPEHAHQIINALLAYFSLFLIVSPVLSSFLVPSLYGPLSRRTRLNWDVRVVSFIQASFICAAALNVIFTDKTRSQMDAQDRLWKYSPSSGRVQAFAAGYFIWDLIVSIQYLQILGPGSLAHAASALVITMMGFRPFANFYGINFILYELSTPFLNIHWFLDKVGKTGSTMQLVNGICLITSFFGCRIAWGWYQSFKLYHDAWSVLNAGASAESRSFTLTSLLSSFVKLKAPTEESSGAWWLVVTFVAANTILCALNLYWFGLMIQALKKRFQPAKSKTS